MKVLLLQTAEYSVNFRLFTTSKWLWTDIDL